MVTEKYYGKLGQALIYTDFINEMYKANLLFEVDVFTLHQGFWAIVDYVKGEPVKKPLFTIGSLFNQMCRGDLVQSTALGKMDSVATGNGFTAFNKVGSSITSPDGKNFNLLLISRDFENDQNVSIELPVGTFDKTATIKTVSAPNWNVDVESNLNIKTESISNFASGTTFKVPKHAMVIVSFSGDLKLITGNENNDKIVASDDFQISPNPLTQLGIVNFQLSQPSETIIEIKDLAGTKVSTILNEYKSSGNYTVNINSETLAPGMYMCTLTTNHKVVTKKIIIQK